MVFENLVDNPVVQTLANNSPFPHVDQIVAGWFLFDVYASVKRTGSRHKHDAVWRFVITMVRAFSSLYFLVPLVLGRLPGDFVNRSYDGNFHHYLTYLVIMFVVEKSDLPFAEIYEKFAPVRNLIVSIVLAHNLVEATHAGQAAFAGSLFAPCAIGFLGVAGHLFLENGVSKALDFHYYDADVLLAVVGPALYLGLTAWFDTGVPAVIAKVLLVLFRYSAEYVDYNDLVLDPVVKVWERFEAVVTSRPAAASPKRSPKKSPKKSPVKKSRGRTATPMRKKSKKN